MLKQIRDYFFHVPEDAGRPVYTHGPVIRRFTLGYVILSVGIVLGLFLSYKQTAELHKIADQSRNAACQQRRNYEITAQRTRDFLNSGATIPGITSASLQRSIRLNEQNAKALSDVDCDYPPPIKGSYP